MYYKGQTQFKIKRGLSPYTFYWQKVRCKSYSSANMGHLLWKWNTGQRMEPIVMDNFFQAAELSPNQETIHVYPNDFRISLDQ